MHLNSRIKIQLAIFTLISVVAGGVMIFGYIDAPAMVGLGRYRVTVELPSGGGLYHRGNVTYRGTEVGYVEDVRLTGTGAEAVLSLKSGTRIPADLTAQVHSVSAVGEQYVALTPLSADGPDLANGDVIPLSRASVQPQVSTLLDDVNRGLQAIPQDDLKTAIDESYTAFGGLGPELSRIVKGSTSLAIDAHANLQSLLTVIDESGPVLDSQTGTADAVNAWAAHLATISDQLHTNDAAVAGIVEKTGPAAERGRQLFERLSPTVPVIMSNLVSVGKVAVTYQPAIEQILVLVPQAIANSQAGYVASRNTKQDITGPMLDFNLNLNLPAPCTTGFLPPQQQRSPSLVDYPDRPAGDLYCRIPQDAPNAVRGLRNLPCLTRPGKRAPTVKMCESDQEYVPLNDGNNWKGDPNATLTGQGVPQLPVDRSAPPSSAPAPVLPSAATPPPVAVAPYDPATGAYVGPDGHVYTQADLGPAKENQTWQSMLTPASAP